MGNSKINLPAPKFIRGKLREVKVNWDLYAIGAYCVVGPYHDLAKYAKWRQKRTVVLPPVKPEALYVPSTDKVGGIIWLPRTPRSAHALGTLVHEVGHAVIDLMGCVGVGVNKRNQEPFCYAIGHAVEVLLQELRRTRSG